MQMNLLSRTGDLYSLVSLAKAGLPDITLSMNSTALSTPGICWAAGRGGGSSEKHLRDGKAISDRDAQPRLFLFLFFLFFIIVLTTRRIALVNSKENVCYL